MPEYLGIEEAWRKAGLAELVKRQHDRPEAIFRNYFPILELVFFVLVEGAEIS
jgi:hypothetical protein